MKPKEQFLGSLILSSLTLMVIIFLVWEFVQKNFFAQADLEMLRYLYVTRGIALGAALSVWSAWFISRSRKKFERQGKVLEAQLFQAEKLAALGELIGGVAHEINNPVGIMVSRIELMIEDAKRQGFNPTALKDMEVLHRQASRIGAISQNLLSFARKTGAEYAVVSLNDVVKATLPLIEHELKRKGIALESHLGDRLAPIKGNFNQLQQVLLNLLTNARDALLNDEKKQALPQIKIATWQTAKDPLVRLCVVDNGSGIAQEHLPKVFDPFFTTKSTGTGLGLAVSYGIIKEHGGVISVGNDGERRACGTCLMVSLPAAKET